MTDDLNNDCCVPFPMGDEWQERVLALLLTLYLMSEEQNRNKERDENLNDGEGSY